MIFDHKNGKILLLVILGIFLTFQTSLAGSFGASPPEIFGEVVRGDIFEATIVLSRSNPSKDEYMNVSKDSDPFDVIILPETKVLLPVGEQQVRYHFTMNTAKLDETTLFENLVTFVQQAPEETGQETKILQGVSIKIQLKILSEPTLQMQAIAYEQMPDPRQIQLTSVFENESKLALGLRNDSDIIVKNIPFSIHIQRKGKGLESMQGNVEGYLESYSTKTEQIDLKNQNLQAGDLITVKIGENGNGLDYTIKRHFSFSKLMNGVLLKMNSWYQKLKFIHAFVDVESEKFSLDRGFFFLIKKENADDRIIHTFQTQTQTLSGNWDYYPLSDNHVYAISQKPAETSAHQVFLLSDLNVYPLNASKLPGKIDLIQEDSSSMYALFSGVNNEDKSPFYCLTELFIMNGPDCLYLEQILDHNMRDVHFLDEKPNQIAYRTDEGYFSYDIWTKKRLLLDGAYSHAQNQSTALTELFTEKKIKTKTGFIKLENQWFFTEPSSSFFKLMENVYIQKTQKQGENRLWIVNARNKQRRYLGIVSDSDHFFWLKTDGFVTNP